MLRQAGLRLRAVREALTLDQPRMAAELGVSRSALAMYEVGDRPMAVPFLVRLFLRFHVGPDWIALGLRRGLDYDVGPDVEAKAAELGAAVGGPVPEWPNAVNSQGVARAPGHRPRRPAGRTIHEDNA